jgi:hypothetical protein
LLSPVGHSSSVQKLLRINFVGAAASGGRPVPWVLQPAAALEVDVDDHMRAAASR